MKQKDLKIIAAKQGVPIATIDKDWVLSHFLNAMFSLVEVQESNSILVITDI